MTGALLALVLAFPSPPQFGLPAIGGGGNGNKFTGSPRSKWDCAVCHEGEALPPVRVTAQGESPFEGGYQPGKSYPLELAIDGEAMSAGVSFELLTREGTRAGALALSGALPTELACDDGSDPLAIGKDGVAMSRSCRSGIAAWRVVWTAPEADVGPVTLYAGAVDADKDGSCRGDRPGSATVAIRAQSTAPPPNPASCAGIGLLPLGVLAALWRRRGRGRGAFLAVPLLALGVVFVSPAQAKPRKRPPSRSAPAKTKAPPVGAPAAQPPPGVAAPAPVSATSPGPGSAPAPSPGPAPGTSKSTRSPDHPITQSPIDPVTGSPKPGPASAGAASLAPATAAPASPTAGSAAAASDQAPADAAATELAPVASTPPAAPESAASTSPAQEPPLHYAEASATVGAGMRSLLLVSPSLGHPVRLWAPYPELHGGLTLYPVRMLGLGVLRGLRLGATFQRGWVFGGIPFGTAPNETAASLPSRFEAAAGYRWQAGVLSVALEGTFALWSGGIERNATLVDPVYQDLGLTLPVSLDLGRLGLGVRLRASTVFRAGEAEGSGGPLRSGRSYLGELSARWALNDRGLALVARASYCASFTRFEQRELDDRQQSVSLGLSYSL